MAQELSGRPLTGDDVDQARYVRRQADDRAEKAIEHGLNVLLSARRGQGATSLLYRLESKYADRSTYLAVPQLREGLDLLRLLDEHLTTGVIDRAYDRARRGTDPIGVLRARLDEREADTTNPWIALIDGPVPADAAHQLFGGLRDAVFALPLRWVVAAPAERLGEYSTPPADVFFESVVHVDGLNLEGRRELLERRGIALPSARLDEVLRLSDGSPRHVLALARQALLEPDESLDDRSFRDWLARQAGLSRSGAALFEAMQGRGPVTVTDAELRHQLGWGVMRVRRAMSELIDAGLVRSSQGRAEGPGRPPTVYRIAPGPPGAAELGSA